MLFINRNIKYWSKDGEDKEIIKQFLLSQYVEKNIHAITKSKTIFYPKLIQSEDYLNIFTGFLQKPTPGHKVNHHRIKRQLNHIKEVWCRNNKKAYKYILDWFADMIQHPERKNGTYLVLIGEEGSGKNIIAEFIAYLLIGDEYSSVINDMSKFTGRFNSFSNGKVFTVFDEAMTGKDILRHANKFKSFVSQRKQVNEMKHKDAEIIDDYNHFMLLSNNRK